MELRHLRYFVAVAEELSFTRGAERLHMGQPPLSQQIQALEGEIGARLFDRTRRGVRLTEAGTLFLTDARRILSLASSAAETARRAERGEIGLLRIGFTKSIPFSPIFPKVINAYRRKFPNVTLMLQEMPTLRQFAAFGDHSLDLGFLRPPEADVPENLALTGLCDHPLSVAMPQHHGLANQADVSVEDLKGEDFIMFPRDEGTTLNPHIYRLCREAGFEPNVVMEAREATTIIGLVAAGCGISILPDLFGCVGINGVRFQPIRATSASTRLVLANRRDAESPLIKAFLDITKESSGLMAKP